MCDTSPNEGGEGISESYRPVSVLPITAKIFEAMVHTQLYSYTETNSLLHVRFLAPAQYPGYNWPVDDWMRALDNNEITGTIMTNLSKAFDSVDHQPLLEKLDAYEIKEGKWNLGKTCLDEDSKWP